MSINASELIQVAMQGFAAYERFVETYNTTRAALSTSDQMLVDAAYNDMKDRSNRVADILRGTPDDTVEKES